MKSVFFSYFFPSLHVLFGTETTTMISYQLKFLYVEYTLPLVRKERRQPRSKKKEKCNALSCTLQKAAPSLSSHFFFVMRIFPFISLYYHSTRASRERENKNMFSEHHLEADRLMTFFSSASSFLWAS